MKNIFLSPPLQNVFLGVKCVISVISENRTFFLIHLDRMNFSSPLKKRRTKVDDSLKDFKKKRPLLSNASVKRICSVKTSDTACCQWLQNWIEQLVRERSYPPQLVSDDFYSLLSRYFDSKVIIEILEKVRYDYRRAFPLSEPIEEVDSLDWLPDLIRSDPNALLLLPLHYL